MKLPFRIVTAGVAAALGLAGVAAPAVAKDNAGGVKASVMYDSLVSPLPANLPSVGAEANAFDEFGNEVTFSSGSGRQLTSVVVTMSSWGCMSGHWYSHDCATPAGSTFSEPITLNIYDPPASASPSTPGSLIKSVTQTFHIPYRPSASPRCTGSDAGKWWDPSSKCVNGLAVNLTFDLSDVTVPDSVVYGISYNTTDYGPSPYGSLACPAGGCGYDSLNIALSQDDPGHPSLSDVTIGSDNNPGTVWQNSPYGSEYCDAGSAGTNSFRLDSPSMPCWGVDSNNPSQAPYYVPAVQFRAG